jgi:hypothetical protein
MADVDHVVHFRVIADAGGTDGGAIDRAVAADFNAIAQFHIPRLLHLVPAFARRDEPKALSADHCAAVDHAVLTYNRSLLDRAVGMENGAIAHLAVRVDHNIRKDTNVITNHAVCANYCMGCDRDVLAQLCGGIHDSGGVNRGSWLVGFVKSVDGLGEEHAGIFGFNPGNVALDRLLLKG